MEKESKGFGRRDFMKLGIAAGLVAGIPTGIIPTPATRKAFAKVGSNTRGVFPPTLDELQSIAEQYHLHMSREDLKVYQSVIEGAIGSYRRVGELQEPKLPVKYARNRDYRPSL